MSLRYTDEKLRDMAMEFLSMQAKPRHALVCTQLLSALMNHFKMTRDECLSKIHELAEQEIR